LLCGSGAPARENLNECYGDVSTPTVQSEDKPQDGLTGMMYFARSKVRVPVG